MGVKYCSRCGELKPLGEFRKRRAHSDGVASECKMCALKRDCHYRETHREECRERSRRWQEANPERHREKSRLYCAANPGKRRETGRRYRRANLEKRREYDQRRRAREVALPVTLTQGEWEAILARYGYSCAYCGVSWLDGVKLQQEHVIPVSRGGGYTADNIVPACKSCNSHKNGRTPEEAGMKLGIHDE